MSNAYLMVGDDLVATLGRTSVDMPWFEARFIPTERFAEFAPLFDRELQLVEGPEPLDVEEWERTMQEIYSRGAVLVLPDGERVQEFMLHVYPDGTARFRY